VHKLRLSLKELRESGYWLRLIGRSAMLPQTRLKTLLDECEQLSNILAKSILTASANDKNSRQAKAQVRHSC